jgi:hypothetical protein
VRNHALLGAAARISAPAAWLALTMTSITLLLLTSLHVLSPEYAPSWRMVSEYALGHYSWALSLMFLAWGVSSWALAAALWPQVETRAGKIGVGFLVVAGLGEAMASVFDMTHDALHTLAGLLGVGGLPIAALLISVSLGRTQAWSPARKMLLRLAHLTWISVALLMVTLVMMTLQFIQATGGQLPQQAPASLPAGVIGLAGWADRLIVLSYCLWIASVAWHAMKAQRQQSAS